MIVSPLYTSDICDHHQGPGLGVCLRREAPAGLPRARLQHSLPTGQVGGKWNQEESCVSVCPDLFLLVDEGNVRAIVEKTPKFFLRI